MKSARLIFLGTLLGLASLACVITIPLPGGAPQPTSTSFETATPPPTATFTLVPSRTPLPSPTRREVSTEAVYAFPTITPLSPIPTMTLPVMQETSALGTFTPTKAGTVAVKIYTPTRQPLKCRVDIVKPEYGEKVLAGKDFEVAWRIYNEGGKIWIMNEFYFDFVSGKQMSNPGYGPKYLPYTVFPRDRFRLNVRMTAPRAPGLYTATWGMWQVGREEPFCTFSVTIKVE
ncbi:MAG: hypothetical protein DDG60_13595 [Anaerolineae bacterium]|nr:MAG: hypothetical protein DDG60_13595 [Anaerolineae bacterium]